MIIINFSNNIMRIMYSIISCKMLFCIFDV